MNRPSRPDPQPSFTRVPLKRRSLLSLTGLLLMACASQPLPVSQSGPAEAATGAPTERVRSSVDLAAPALPDGRSLTPLRELNGPKPSVLLRPLALNANTAVVGLKVLILSAGTTDSALSAAKTMLDQSGVPYDVINPALPGSFSAAALVAEGGGGKYQGVLLTTGNLAYEPSPGVWQSALDWTGWNVLWQYERDYKVRQLALYTYPSAWPEDYGLRDAGGASASADARLTADGQAALSDLKPGAAVPIRNAYTYRANLVNVPGVVSTPLLTDAGGQVLAARSDADGRERLALTFAQNPYLLHTSLLGSSLVNWLTRGVHLGEYQRFNQLDIDDWFFPGDVFDATTKTFQRDAFRLSASDALALPVQRDALRNAFPVSSAFNLSLMYNGDGAVPSAPVSCDPKVVSADPLSSVTRCLAPEFDWVSHTLEHFYMDFLNYPDSFAQLQPNLDIGVQMNLNLSSHSLLSGGMSGLGYYNPAGDGLLTDHGLGTSNVEFLRAAQNTGTQYLASNHSVPSQWDASCSNCGLIHPLNPNIFLVPRWPTNVFYDVTDPAQATAAYNSVYAPGGSFPFWDHALSYAEFLDKETDIALAHVLSGGAYPHYMHQDNARQYAPGRSLVYDWEAALLGKYSSYSNLPLRTLRWDDLGAYMKTRTSSLKSGLSGTWNRATNTLTLRSALGGSAYVTGALIGNSQNYGSGVISLTTLGAGQVVTAPVR